MLPSHLSEFGNYPAVLNFVTNHLDMQFDDVRGMMKLPLPKIGITGGCNFAAAGILCNLISGISVVLYTPKKKKMGSGEKFKSLLEDFYPWEPGEKKEDKSKVIYDFIRNPLAHSLGVSKKGSFKVFIKKGPLTEAKLQKIEKSSVRPNWVPQTVTSDPKGYVVSMGGLYWGVLNLVRRLAQDTKQMQKAEERIKKGKII